MVKILRVLRVLRPLRAINRAKGLKVCCWEGLGGTGRHWGALGGTGGEGGGGHWEVTGAAWQTGSTGTPNMGCDWGAAATSLWFLCPNTLCPGVPNTLCHIILVSPNPMSHCPRILASPTPCVTLSWCP